MIDRSVLKEDTQLNQNFVADGSWGTNQYRLPRYFQMYMYLYIIGKSSSVKNSPICQFDQSVMQCCQPRRELFLASSRKSSAPSLSPISSFTLANLPHHDEGYDDDDSNEHPKNSD